MDVIIFKQYGRMDHHQVTLIFPCFLNVEIEQIGLYGIWLFILVLVKYSIIIRFLALQAQIVKILFQQLNTQHKQIHLQMKASGSWYPEQIVLSYCFFVVWADMQNNILLLTNKVWYFKTKSSSLRTHLSLSSTFLSETFKWVLQHSHYLIKRNIILLPSLQQW